MAITADAGPVAGTPTSWSAAVDALASGREFDTLNGRLGYIDDASIESHPLFIISAGNVREYVAAYLDRCDQEPIEDPAQAWNELTVGAFTDLVDPEGEASRIRRRSRHPGPIAVQPNVGRVPATVANQAGSRAGRRERCRAAA